MHQKASMLKSLRSRGYIEVPAPVWITHPNEEQSLVNYLPAVSLYLNSSLAFFPVLSPTTGICSMTASVRAWIIILWNFPFMSPEWKVSFVSHRPLLLYTKQREQESARIIFSWYSSCADRRLWLWGKWNTHHSRFMDQRWHLQSASTAHCRCGALEDGRGRRRSRKCALSWKCALS